MIYRKLRQDVALFNATLREAAIRFEHGDEEMLAAKIVGRWRNGTPLVNAPDRPNPDSRPQPGRATTSAISTSTPTVGGARSARTSGAPTHATHSGGPASMEPACSASATASSVAERPAPSR
jgi:hypothetical protein